MRAVFDTSPLCYLILIGEADVLPALFSEILIPDAVADELTAPRSPVPVLDWMRAPPRWLECRRVDLGERLEPSRLHPGELAAITLAKAVGADWVVLDEKAAREEASSLGLAVTGLLGILDLAALRGLLDLPAAVERLRKTSFYVAPGLLKGLLDKHLP